MLLPDYKPNPSHCFNIANEYMASSQPIVKAAWLTNQITHTTMITKKRCFSFTSIMIVHNNQVIRQSLSWFLDWNSFNWHYMSDGKFFSCPHWKTLLNQVIAFRLAAKAIGWKIPPSHAFVSWEEFMITLISRSRILIHKLVSTKLSPPSILKGVCRLQTWSQLPH